MHTMKSERSFDTRVAAAEYLYPSSLPAAPIRLRRTCSAEPAGEVRAVFRLRSPRQSGEGGANVLALEYGAVSNGKACSKQEALALNPQRRSHLVDENGRRACSFSSW